MISTTVLTAGAMVAGCGGDPFRNERMAYRPLGKTGLDIAMVQKLYDLTVVQPSVPDSVRQHYLALKHHAGECERCKSCEKRCPFHVKVHERMQKTAKLFGC